MRTIYRYLCVFMLSAVCGVAAAQNLDPTVVVDRAYEGKLVEFHKPALEMSVPDSVMRFDLDFDYSVFENPYKGSYEFNPYLLSMKPSVTSDAEGKFYLRAGAGYSLRPELDMVWSPKMKNNGLSLDVYARHRSYFGEYQKMTAEMSSLPYMVDDVAQASNGGFMSSKAGLSIGYDWKKTSVDFSAGYYGLHRFLSGNAMLNYNAVDADFSVGTRAGYGDGLVYDIDASFRHASDNGVNENNLEADIVFATPVKKGGRFALDLGFGLDGYSGAVSGNASVVSITPRYVYRKGILDADLGLKISKVVVDTTSRLFIHNAKEQIVYPDVTVRLALVRDALSFFIKAGGGNTIYSNADLLERNMFLDIRNRRLDQVGVNFGSDMGVGVERISAKAGFDGRFGSRFSWNLHAGYVDYASAIHDAAYPLAGLFGMDYVPYKTWNGTFEWLWKSDRFMADGTVTYRNVWGGVFGSDRYLPAVVIGGVFRPAAVTGDVSFEYNYNKRIFAGINCAFSTSRECEDGLFVIPGYADLGVSAEYVTSGSLSFWLRGGNLLGMSIQRNPLFAVKGPYFTLGICLKL